MQLHPREPIDPNRGVSSWDFWLLILRAFVVFGMIYYQVIPHAPLAWGLIWKETAWDLVDQFSKIGFPYPPVTAVVFLVLLMISLLGLGLGFVVRINAALFLGLVVLVLFAPLDLSPTLLSQTLMLYIGSGFLLILSGGGLISLDGLLTRRKNRPRY